MRIPRMTTRRWMIVVAVVALSLGTSLYSVRLKRKRDSHLARASWHSSMEAYALRWLTRVPAPSTRLEPVPASMTSDELITAIDVVSGLLSAGSDQDEDDDFRADQEEREHAIAASKRRIEDEFQPRELAYYRKRADYHAALARKYRNAARYPWLAVEPDPRPPAL